MLAAALLILALPLLGLFVTELTEPGTTRGGGLMVWTVIVVVVAGVVLGG